ncbi:glycosyltransferase family 4 protein [Niveispirillum fermenti]|uniref:glycosyltransferase family 4 protein n=1 Tax=Niveispirillum fermenti TaxID=1233113 RepID=UPI003A84386E
MALTVTFSHDIFTSQAVGGISRYFCELALALRADGADIRIPAGRYLNQHLRDMAPACSPGMLRGRHVQRGRMPVQALRLLNEGWAALATRGGGIFHRTYYPLVDLMPLRRPLVTTVHDMVWEMYPGEARSYPINSRLKRRAVARADLIIVPTVATKQDLCRLWDVRPDNVYVVNHGFTPLPAPDAEGPAAARVHAAPYVLFVGRRGGYKNFANFLAGYAASRLPADGVDLLCFGGGAFGPADMALVAGHGLTDRVRWMGGDDITMMRAYRDALVFIYPSRCEGFGLPVLEAMGAGCPVALAAEAEALVEVAGGAAVTYDADSRDATVSMLESLAEDGERRRALVLRGRQRVGDFGWQRCARETAALYAMLA